MLSVQGFSRTQHPPVEAQAKRAILFAVEFTRRNNQRELIHAAAILYARAVFVPITLVGSGNPRVIASTLTLARLLGIEKQITYIDAQEPSLLQFREHQVCVISREKGADLLLARAKAAGCEHVVMSYPVIRDAIASDYARSVPPQDAQALANVLEDMLHQPDPTPSHAWPLSA